MILMLEQLRLVKRRKGTSQDEVTSNSEEIRPAALAIPELRLSAKPLHQVAMKLHKFPVSENFLLTDYYLMPSELI